MSPRFHLNPFHPCPSIRGEALDASQVSGRAMMAIRVECKYLLIEEESGVSHEYHLPPHPAVHNCSGYFDKIVRYRDPALFEHLIQNGVSRRSFSNPAHPILATRSPQLDLLLFGLILDLQERRRGASISLFDLGCTLAEHWDLLDAMLRAHGSPGRGATDCLDYTGLDRFALLISAAHLLHRSVSPERFRLIASEGSSFDFGADAFDLTLSVGVVNHVFDPLGGLKRLLRATRFASVLALWTTAEPKGFWTSLHSGTPIYLFSLDDLERIQAVRPGGQFFQERIIPETSASQSDSFVSIDRRRLEDIDCRHLVYSTLPRLPFPARPLFAS